MQKNAHIVLFFLLLAILLGAARFFTGSLLPGTGPESMWFNGGLFALLFGRFITEYKFTKPTDVFANCAVAFVSISTLDNPPLENWWNLLRWSALICGAVAIAIAWDPGRRSHIQNNPFRTILYRTVTTLGKAEVLFSVIFVLAVLSYFRKESPEATVFVLLWGAFLLMPYLELDKLFQLLFQGFSKDRRVALGVVKRYLAPSIVYVQRLDSHRFKKGDIVGFTSSANNECDCLGVVIDEIFSAGEDEIVVALHDSSISKAQFASVTYVTKLNNSDRDRLVPRPEEIANFNRIVGTVIQGSNISRLQFELHGQPTVSAGLLLQVRSGATEVFYQVFDGEIEERPTMDGSSRAFVEGDAEQIGCWSSDRGGFETHDWVAGERALVFGMDSTEAAPQYELKPGEIKIGSIPNSSYPVNIDLNDLTLFHASILGVTGSGKSFLAFSIIEQCAHRGIKVVCVDPTGDYQRYLEDSVILNTSGALDTFLGSPDHRIGIIETASSTLNPIVQTLTASQKCLNWCKNNRAADEVLHPKPKVLLVLEEAHILVPEWNFASSASRDMQPKVNETAQVVLQARKYGLGFLIISQRTANVTKSVLNQSNTIVSFQAFDETGFDFLKNYMGNFHVRSLPNLKPRHCILVGKASRSRRPVMVRLEDQQRPVKALPSPPLLPPVQGLETT